MRSRVDDFDYYLTKGPIMARFDRAATDFLRLPEHEAQAVLEVLATEKDLISLAASALLLNERQTQHLQEHWIKAWWPGEPVEEILRAGFLEAGRLVRALRLPLSCYRCAGAPHFGVTLSCSDQQITLVVHTPPTPVDQRSQGLLDPDIILIRADADGQVISVPMHYPD